MKLNLILLNVFLIGMFFLTGCADDIQDIATPEPEPIEEPPIIRESGVIKGNITWVFKDLDWDKESTHREQAIYTLELIDTSIYNLELSKFVGGANYHSAMAQLIETRALVLMQLYAANPPKYNYDYKQEK